MSMSRSTKPSPFALQVDDWKHYLQNRPSYPESMWNAWLDYHKGPLKTVHELGTGCGIGAASLLSASKARDQPVEHMILSDPSENNLTTAREILRANHYPGAELSFHQKMGEDSFLEPDSVDMAIACECLHYTDVDKAIASIHSSLRPGGTVASVFYSVLSSRICDDERADAAWRAFAQMHYKRLLDEKVETIFARVMPSQLGVGLNFVSMESDKWKDVKRIFFNVPSGQTEWPLEVGLEELMKAKGTSRIGPEYDSLEWRSDPDGWGIEDCTVERIREMLVSWHLEYDEKDWQSKEWREFEAAVNGACGKCHFVFPATIILGRKK